MTRAPRSPHGIALPTVLIALLALSALALAMTAMSRSEVVISGLQERAMQTLQIADAALNYSLGIPDNFADPVSQPLVDLRPQGLPFDADIKVDYEPPSRLPPVGINVSALKMKAFFFLLNSQGYMKSRNASQPDSATHLEMEVAKLGPAGS